MAKTSYNLSATSKSWRKQVTFRGDDDDVRFVLDQHVVCVFIVIAPQALVSFKKGMPPPLPYFKVNIYGYSHFRFALDFSYAF
jgi:hypothetical protein